MKKAYHVREWLNPKGTFACSMITAFHGPHSFLNDKDESIEYTETNLRISDCQETVRIHVINGDIKAYIKKLRVIAKVCTNFADYLEEQYDLLRLRRQKKS